MYTERLSTELQEKIADLYLNHHLVPTEIAKRLGFKYHQPVYNSLKKQGIFERFLTRYGDRRLYEVDETYFERIDSEAKAYFFGFIAADGYRRYYIS